LAREARDGAVGDPNLPAVEPLLRHVSAQVLAHARPPTWQHLDDLRMLLDQRQGLSAI
jgi:hypothetical protein